MCVYIGARTHMHMLVCLLHVLCGHVSVRGCAWAHMCVLLTLWGERKQGEPQAEGEADSSLSRESDVRLDLRVPGSCPEQKANT